MLSLEEYLQDPCGKLSIPFWKAKIYPMPKDMMVVHTRDLSHINMDNYTDQKFFRLYHSREKTEYSVPHGFKIITTSPDTIEDMVSIINRSYLDLTVSREQLIRYTQMPAYHPGLWILLLDTTSMRFAGCGIADFDNEAKELSLEWIQVLPEYRRQKIGWTIVSELLHRMRETANFATVSGKMDTPANPEAFYRACHFTGRDIWHVLHAK